MYLREHFSKKINSLEGIIKHIEFHVKRTNFQEALNSVEQGKEIIEELRAAVEREPITPNEINKV